MPSITARIRSRASTASASRFRITTPHASPRTKPLAAASNGRDCPSGDSAPVAATDRVVAGDRIRFTPAATATSQSPAASARQPACDRHQRGRAGGVHREHRSLQPQLVRHPAGGEAVPVADRGVGVRLGRLPLPVVQAGDADEHPGLLGGIGGGRQRGVLERLPDHLQQQPVLRVDGAGLARGDVEEPGVEVERPFQVAAGGDHAVPRVAERRPAIVRQRRRSPPGGPGSPASTRPGRRCRPAPGRPPPPRRPARAAGAASRQQRRHA